MSYSVIKVNPKNQTIEKVQVSSYKDYYPLMGCRIFTIAGFFENGDVVFADDEGLLHNEEKHFTVFSGNEFSNPSPIAGTVLIVGPEDENEETQDVQSSIQFVEDNLNFHSELTLVLSRFFP